MGALTVRGPEVEAEEASKEGQWDNIWRLRGRVSGGEWHGTMYFIQRYVTPGRLSFYCQSPIIAWTA